MDSIASFNNFLVNTEVFLGVGATHDPMRKLQPSSKLQHCLKEPPSSLPVGILTHGLIYFDKSLYQVCCRKQAEIPSISLQQPDTMLMARKREKGSWIKSLYLVNEGEEATLINKLKMDMENSQSKD